MDEVVVTGERTGPGMWHVHHGSAQLWILGSLSPLPKGITWKANEVERVLDSTNRVLVPKPIEIGIVQNTLVADHGTQAFDGSRR